MRVRTILMVCAVLSAFAVAPAKPATAADWTGRFSIWRDGAFTPQYLNASCVGATIQMTLNLARGENDRSKKTQLDYLAYAQASSKYPVDDDGADPEGWVQALNHYSNGDSDYGWTTSQSMQSALHLAALQVRATEKPVGLLVHFGRHAWLMTGFESTADPAETTDFEVTAAEVVGPLWPLGTLNGEHFDPGPQTWMTTRELPRKFDAYVEPDQPAWYGKYVMVVPDATAATAQSAGQPGADTPDLHSALGWIYVFQRLARSIPVRDYLWLHR
jgi:hypothetical protein